MSDPIKMVDNGKVGSASRPGTIEQAPSRRLLHFPTLQCKQTFKMVWGNIRKLYSFKASKVDRRNIIIQFYEVVLRRSPRIDEVNLWLKRLSAGMTISQLWQNIYSSLEASTIRTNQRHGLTLSSLTIAQFYETILSRPASTAEIRLWVTQLEKEVPIFNIWEEIYNSEEARNLRNHQEHALTLAWITIAQFYETILSRPASTEEIKLWVRHLEDGMPLVSIWEEIYTSEEAQNIRNSQEHCLTLASITIAQFYETILSRSALTEEISLWVRQVEKGVPLSNIWKEIYTSEEAANKNKTSQGGQTPDDIFTAYEVILGRGPTAREINDWSVRLTTLTREKFIYELFLQRVSEERNRTAIADGRLDAGGVYVVGAGLCSEQQWKLRSDSLSQTHIAKPHRSLMRVAKDYAPRVSVITSLYGGGQHIDKFLNNITSQTIFPDLCELIIVDANSPDGEQSIIADYVAKYPQIKYHRLSYRATIYYAWNFAIQMAKGIYITNANVDDMRRVDSLEIQCAILDNLPFVDVTYQDVFYTLDPNLSYEAIARAGVSTNLPIITPHNLIQYNSPHNAPMWRKTVHDDVGYFNEDLRSAGDWEFWIRCLLVDKTFFKSNIQHVVYYANPCGMSTSPTGPGITEGQDVTRRYSRKLLPRASIEPFTEFQKRCGTPPHENHKFSNRYDYVQSLLRRSAMNLV